MDAAGRSFSTIQSQLTFGIDKLGTHTEYSQYPDIIPAKDDDPTKNTTDVPETATETSIIMVNSQYRDQSTYPQPTYFSIRLPRVYKNISAISFSDMKLLTSFYYFRTTKGNTDITVYEKDRITVDINNLITSTIVKRFIRTGSYNINSLLTEIQLQLNYTPLFFDFPNGINDFITAFRSSGDYFLNFNQPGDYFYNTTTQTWVPNPTINTILSQYWNTRYAGLSYYSNDQILLAYYYPILQEYIQDPDYSNQALDLSTALVVLQSSSTSTLTNEDVIEYLVYSFKGINPPDQIALAAIQANIPTLDTYRLKHTFRYWLINKYTVGLQAQSQNVYITTNSLNTSLVNLLTIQQSKYLTNVLATNNISSNAYNNLFTTVNQTLAVLQGLYTFEQQQFLQYFAVPYSQYTLNYYATLTNPIQVRNGIGAVEIPANDYEAISSGIISYDTNILESLRSNPSYFWPNLSTTTISTASETKTASTIFMINLSTVDGSGVDTLNLIYQLDASNLNPRHTIIESNSTLYSNKLTQSANVVCPIAAGKYTVFTFTSPVRQTLQIETLPRPSVYRVPAYNSANFDSLLNTYFDFNYSFSTFTSTNTYTPNNYSNYTYAYDNIPSSNLLTIPGWSLCNAINEPFRGGFGTIGYILYSGTDVSYNGSNQWIAVGNGTSSSNCIQTSTDGYRWNSASYANFDYNYAKGVAYGSNLWIAVGASGLVPQLTIQTSTDGLSWDPIVSGGFDYFGSQLQYGNGIAYGSNLWVAVGSDLTVANTIQYSTDGSNWMAATTGGFDNRIGNRVAWNGSNTWIAVGSGSSPETSIQVSTDGSNWYSSSNNGFDSNTGYGIAWNGLNRWVAVGAGSSPLSTILTSTDGSNWEGASNGGFDSNIGYGISWNGIDQWIAVGYASSSKSTIQVSTDGFNWEAASNGGFDSNIGYSVAYGSNRWVAVGSASSARLSIQISIDGYNWSQAVSGGFYYANLSINQGGGIAYGSNQWVSVGLSSESQSTIKTSRDGFHWSIASNGGFDGTYGNGVAYGSSKWVAVGSSYSENTTIQTSTDGLNWFPTSNGGFTNGVGFGVAYQNTRLLGVTKRWVAVGAGFSPEFTIQSSTDAYNWFPASNGGFEGIGYGVAYGSNRWVAVGNHSSNTIQTSTDSYYWVPASNGGFNYGYGKNVSWNGSNRWIAVGGSTIPQSTIQISTDGFNWLAASNGGFDSNIGNGVAWNGSNLWVAVGSATSAKSTIQTSTDGFNWKAASNGGFDSNQGNSVAWNGSNQWIATGLARSRQSTIQTSTDGFNWNVPVFQDYSWGQSYNSSIQNYTSNSLLNILNYKRSQFYQFTTPDVLNLDTSINNMTYTFNLSIQFYSSITSPAFSYVSTNTDCRMFLYHDRAAFQADAYLNLRNENSRFFKYSTFISSIDTSGSIQFTTYPRETYYVSFRPESSNFGNIYTRITPWFSNPIVSTLQNLSIYYDIYSGSTDGINPATDIYLSSFSTLINTNFNYAQVYDSNWISLPIDRGLWPPDPSSNSGNFAVSISNIPIGYDTNSVSTDYTDYVPYLQGISTITFAPYNNLGIDPINQYQFQSNSAYDSTLQTFLYSDAANYIFQPGLINTYTPTTILTNQKKIVHYYSLNYLPESDIMFPLNSNLINQTESQRPYTTTTTNGPIAGYMYGGNTTSTIQLSGGVMGFNFIPTEGVWNINQIVFRSAISDSNNDPNSNIAYLGVYNMGSIINQNTTLLSMSTAISILKFSTSTTYTSTITVNTNSYDIKGGTYYSFINDSNFVSQTAQSILGYTQFPKEMSDEPESMYTAIAFSKYGSAITIKALSGSTIPYPFYNNISTGTNYFDGTPAYNSTTNIVLPSSIGQTLWPFATELSSLFAPPEGIDESQSQYALSIPIGTSVVNYKNTVPISMNTNYVWSWNTVNNPSYTIGTVKDYVLLQDNNVYIYDANGYQVDRIFGTPKWTLSIDEIFSLEDATSLVGIAGNSSYYYFLGFQNTYLTYNEKNKLRLKRYDPSQGSLVEYTLNDPSFQITIGGTVQSFLINDNEQFVLSYQNTDSRTSLYYTLNASTVLFAYTVPETSNVACAMDPMTSTLYWMPLNSTTGYGSNVYKLDLTTSFPGIPFSIIAGSNATSIPNDGYTGFAVNASFNIPDSNDRLFFINKTLSNGIYSSNIYYSSYWSLSSEIQVQKLSTIIKYNTIGIPITSITTGYRGGLWITTPGYKPLSSSQLQGCVWGTRNTDPDMLSYVASAWQIFYPFQKINLNKIANQYNAITDLSYLYYPEYPHTEMFYYDNSNTFLADTTNKWGYEVSTNFVVADTNLSGYYFNSYIFDVPLTASSNSNDYKYIAVRGYTPSESSETLLRFILPNKYDFGYPTQIDLINEIQILNNNPSQLSNFTVQYAYVLSNFDSSFQQSNNYFGQGILPNFNGSNITTSNFQEFSSNISTIWQSYQNSASTIQGITDAVNSNMLNYIGTTLQYIIPAFQRDRLNFTDPITFKVCWQSSLLPQYAPLLQNWGLGYNLGFAKQDTSIYTTYTKAPSFYKILDDYIYLRLNPEYKMNRLDTTAPENLKLTRDATGQIDNYYCKLLLNSFNSFSSSLIQNQSRFNPMIGRLETMYFEWVDIGGTQIDDTQCDWSASLTITENIIKSSPSTKQPILPLLNTQKK
jgi:hypothetical protein